MFWRVVNLGNSEKVFDQRPAPNVRSAWQHQHDQVMVDTTSGASSGILARVPNLERRRVVPITRPSNNIIVVAVAASIAGNSGYWTGAGFPQAFFALLAILFFVQVRLALTALARTQRRKR
jgi:hypothetical protein